MNLVDDLSIREVLALLHEQVQIMQVRELLALEFLIPSDELQKVK